MEFFVGLDLGQVADFSALIVLQQIRGEGKPVYEVRHIQRFKLGTSYPTQVEHVCELLARPELAGKARLIVDGTGVGVAVVDLFRQRLPNLCAITIHGGDLAIPKWGAWSTPKRDLVGVVQALLQTGRLRFAAGLPETKLLTKELKAFEVRIQENGRDQYGCWREGEHDDLVLALAMACWYADRGQGYMPTVSLTAPRDRDPLGMSNDMFRHSLDDVRGIR